MATSNKRGTNVDATNGSTWASTSSAVDGNYGENNATYATWTSSTRLATAYIEIGNFDFSAIPTGSTINSVTVYLRHYESNTTRVASVTFQPYVSGSGIGSAYTCTRATSARTDSTTFTMTLAQLQDASMCVRVNATRYDGTSSSIERVDYVDMSVDYTDPNANISATTVAAVAAVGSPAIEAHGPNLLSDDLSSAEGYSSGWYGSSCTVAGSTAQASYSTSSFLLTQNAGTSYFLWGDVTSLTAVTEGKVITVQAEVRPTVETTGMMNVATNLANNYGTEITLPANTWTKISKTYTIGAGVDYIEMHVFLRGGGTATAYVDKIGYWVGSDGTWEPAPVPGATVDATTVAAVAAVPAPTSITAEKHATVSASTVAAVAAVPAPTSITAVTNVAPATIAAAATVPAPDSITAASNATVTATAVAAVGAVPAPASITAESNATVTPSTVAAIAAVDTPTVTTVTDATVTATTVGALAAVDTPTVTAEQHAAVSATTVAAVAAVPAPDSITAESHATVAVTTVAATAAVETPTLAAGTGTTVTATTVDAVAAVLSPNVATSSTVTAITAEALVAVEEPTVTAGTGTTVTATTVDAVTEVPAVSLSTGTSLTATSIDAVTDVLAPTVTAEQNATVSATTVTTIAAINTPSVFTESDANISATVVAAITNIPEPEVSTESNAAVDLGDRYFDEYNDGYGGSVRVVAAINVPSVSTGADTTISATLVAASTSIPQPEVSAEISTTSATVDLSDKYSDEYNDDYGGAVRAVVTISQPTISAQAEAIVEAVTVNTVSVISPVTVLAGRRATATATTVAAVIAVPAVEVVIDYRWLVWTGTEERGATSVTVWDGSVEKPIVSTGA